VTHRPVNSAAAADNCIATITLLIVGRLSQTLAGPGRAGLSDDWKEGRKDGCPVMRALMEVVRDE